MANENLRACRADWFENMPQRASTLPSHCLTILGHAKQNHAGVGIEEHEQEHGHDDEEAAEHGHHDGEHQHFQRRLKQGALAEHLIAKTLTRTCLPAMVKNRNTITI